MLEELTIRDFALMDRVQVRFETGLNLLSGETGAGKSILIGALGFLLGGKADTGIIRAGAEETLVSGVIDIKGNDEALAWLADHGMECEDGTLIIRRSLRNTGRGSIYIQNAPSVRQDLADLTSLLVDMHGQHEHQSLLNPESHRRLLDRFARIEPEAAEFSSCFSELTAKRKTFDRMIASEKERSREIDILRFAVDEIDKAALKSGEESSLEEEERLLSQYEKLYSAIEGGRDILNGGQESVLSQLRRVRSQLETASGVDGRLSEAARRVDDAYYELEDVSEALRQHLDSFRYSPERLEELESRLASIQKLKRKYGESVEEVLAYATEGRERLERLEHWEEDRGNLESEIARAEKDLYERALALSDKRRQAAGGLERRIGAIIATLGMPSARFAVRLARKQPDGGKAVVGQNGVDDIEFLISPNRGEGLRELVRVASGGELSRIMLAVKTVLAEEDNIGTLIFDEIDTGIGGEVALAVGRHLQDLAAGKQVLCITHLASVAARADNHYKVEKTVEGDRTLTRVARLDGDARDREIARMLAGDAEGEVSIAHARDLLSRLRRSVEG
ncbi:MAG: DNA repair protein RecN [Spirochaetes bacterium]|nr:DNA repair protein RecN [Spirochaetota bacterium]